MWAPISMCMGNTRGSKKEKDLEAIGSRRWGTRGSEEGWGHATKVGGAENPNACVMGREIVWALSGQF